MVGGTVTFSSPIDSDLPELFGISRIATFSGSRFHGFVVLFFVWVNFFSDIKKVHYLVRINI